MLTGTLEADGVLIPSPPPSDQGSILRLIYAARKGKESKAPQDLIKTSNAMWVSSFRFRKRLRK